MTLRLRKVEVKGRLTPALEIQAQGCEFCSLTRCPSHFDYILSWLSLSWIRISGSPRTAGSSHLQHRYQSFSLPHGILGVLWRCCINLCALRMRQWRAQTFLCIVSNQIRVLFHLKMRAILEGKSQQKIENKTGGGCFLPLLRVATFSSLPRETHSNKFLFVYLVFLIPSGSKTEPGCQQRVMAVKNAWWEYWFGVLQPQPALRLLLINWLRTWQKTCFPYLCFEHLFCCLIN